MTHLNPTVRCTCAEVHVIADGNPTRREVLSRNWNPDCRQHGLTSAWWMSPEQVARRRRESERLLVLRTKARHARRLGIGCHARPAEELEPVGECPICDLTRFELDNQRVDESGVGIGVRIDDVPQL